MALEEDLRQIGEEGFEAINRFFGQQQQQHYLYHRSEAPLESVPSPYVAYRTTKVSQVPHQFFSPLEPPCGFLFSRFFPVKQQNPPKRMGESRGFPPLGHRYVQYPPQEQHENVPEGQVPAAEAADMNNFKAAQLFDGITRVDYGGF